ncbi:hypothetical protein [Paenibacillus sp. KN14-4R]|uniref:hypothetical protein n=1 Tax=Paenibacillus sp. KN14-4R TaxID=3445773 RepID=UPI003FA184C9
MNNYYPNEGYNSPAKDQRAFGNLFGGGSAPANQQVIESAPYPIEASYSPYPVNPGGAVALTEVGAATAAKGSGLLNLGQVKGFIDRMGGIEGIVGTMNKVQGFMNSFQQMAPMIKMVFSSFSKNKSSSLEDPPRTSRRRRKKRKTSSKVYSGYNKAAKNNLSKVNRVVPSAKPSRPLAKKKPAR